jgi:hypothetical protein
MQNKRFFLLGTLLTAGVILPHVVFGQSPDPSKYTPLVQLPFYPVPTFDLKAGGLQQFLEALFKLLIGVSGVLAVVMIVICGV